jgi:uncharacterized metal-binding protein
MAKKEKPLEVSCVDCKVNACFPDINVSKGGKRKPPPYCPANAQKEAGDKAIAKYAGETHRFARSTTLVENSCYLMHDDGSAVLPMVTLHPRAEELIILAHVHGCKKLGIAFDIDLQDIAKLYTEILEKNGFKVVSVCSKAAAMTADEIGITGKKAGSKTDGKGTINNGVVMAELLNSEKTDMNILIGLGVGQDSLFYKYAKAFSVPLMIRDRVYGGATMESIYQSFNSWGFRNYTDDITNGFEFMRENMVKKAGVEI